MKKIFSVSMFLLLLGSFVYSQQIFGMANPNIKQFIVKDKKGNLFSMNMKIEKVTEMLGTPKSSENLWAKYPDASCGFYKVQYDGISFYYYDIDNKIARIDVYNSEYFILDNNVSYSLQIFINYIIHSVFSFFRHFQDLQCCHR